MSVPFVTGNVTATDWFILLYYYIRDLGLLCVNSGLLYLSCMLIGFGFLGNKLFVSTADRLRAVLDSRMISVVGCSFPSQALVNSLIVEWRHLGEAYILTHHPCYKRRVQSNIGKYIAVSSFFTNLVDF